MGIKEIENEINEIIKKRNLLLESGLISKEESEEYIKKKEEEEKFIIKILQLLIEESDNLKKFIDDNETMIIRITKKGIYGGYYIVTGLAYEQKIKFDFNHPNLKDFQIKIAHEKNMKVYSEKIQERRNFLMTNMSNEEEKKLEVKSR